MAVQLFGFEIKRKSDEADDKRIRSFVEPNEGDGSINVTATVPGAGAAMSSVVDMVRVVRNADQSQASSTVLLASLIRSPIRAE